MTDETDELDPWNVICGCLNAARAGEPYDEDAVTDMVIALAAAKFVESGVTIDAVEQLFTERDFTIRLTQDSSGIGVQIDWEDDDIPSVAVSQGDGVSS